MVARAAQAGVPLYTSSPGDSSIGMNIAYHELMNGSRFMIDPNKDVNEVCAIVLAGKQNGCVILGGGSPKNFYLQAQPTLWEVYGIPKGGNDYFIQITTDSVVWGGLSGATPAEAVSWGKVNPGVLPDTVVAYCDSTIAFPLFCEYAVGSPNGRRAAQGAGAQARRAGRRPDARGEGGAGQRDDTKLKHEDQKLCIGIRLIDYGHAVLRARAARRAARRAAADLRGRQRARPGIVAHMRQRLHWDVLFVLEDDDLRRASDVKHYQLAQQLRRTLVTMDRDYLDDRRFPPAESGGVLVIQAPDERAADRPRRAREQAPLPAGRIRAAAGGGPEAAPAHRLDGRCLEQVRSVGWAG